MKWQDRQKLGVLLQLAGWRREAPTSTFWSSRNTWVRGEYVVRIDNTRCAQVLRNIARAPQVTFRHEAALIDALAGRGWRERLATAIDAATRGV